MVSAAIEELEENYFYGGAGFRERTASSVCGDNSSALLLAIRSWVAAGRLRLIKSAECGECCGRADEARIQRHLGEAMCAFETKTSSLLFAVDPVSTGRQQLNKKAATQMGAHFNKH